MDRDQLVAHLAHGGCESVVGVLQAGPHGVTADLGGLQHVQDRTHCRRFEERDVGVPPTGPVDLPVYREHLWALVDGREDGMRLGDRTELAGELGLLLGRE